MVDYKKLFVLLMLMLAVIALSGCASSSGDNSTKPMYIVTVGTGPTDQPQLPTDTPVPTPTATPVPTPTPVPEPVTLSNMNIAFSVEGGLEPNTVQYAVRHDTATFTIADTGQTPLVDLSLTYKIDQLDVLTDGSIIHDPRNATYFVGTIYAGDQKNITMQAPLYSAVADVNMTILAKWRDGSLVVYSTFLKSNTSATSGELAPENNLITRSFGFI